MFKLEIDLKNYNTNLPTSFREASRGIIRFSDKYLLIYSTVYKDYKFPGGGVKDNEDYISALIREINEETGYNVIVDSIKQVGIVEEKRYNSTNNTILNMTSYYYECSVLDKKGIQNLDDYEKERDYIPILIDLDTSISANEIILNNPDIPWATRDTKVMKIILKGNYDD